MIYIGAAVGAMGFAITIMAKIIDESTASGWSIVAVGMVIVYGEIILGRLK